MRAELAPYAVDPFGPSANPRAYVACEASERARSILERSLDEGRVAALMGPPGHGKTLLLRLLGGREEERARVAYVPFCTLPFDELCALALNAIGVTQPGSPREVLCAVARELAPRGGVVILVDDAHSLSDECASALAALYEELGGALRIALAAVQGPRAQRVFRAFGAKIDVVLLAGGMSGRESRRYVETRLAYGGARPEIVAAFDDETIDALHRASQGVPRRLNQAAEDVLRRATRLQMPSLRERAARALRQRASPPVAAAPPAAATQPAPRAPAAPAARPDAAAPVAPALPLVRPGRPAPIARPPSAPPVQPAPPVKPAVPPPAAAPAPAATFEPPAPEAPTPRSVEPLPPPPPVRREPPRRAPSHTPAPRAPIRSVPPPAATAEPDVDDGRGILLPEFQRDSGARTGEYRIVRGEAREPTRPRGTMPMGARRPSGTPESVLVTRSETPLAPRSRAIPMPSEYADRVPPPRRQTSGLPIRAIGIAGFVLGVAISMTWIMGRESAPPLPPSAPTATAPPSPAAPAPDAAKAPAAEAAKAPAAEAPSSRPTEVAPPTAPEPEPTPASKRAQPSERAPAPAETVAAPARILVSINATPWAVVSIDGREIGETPLAGVPIEAGRHVFEARMPDGKTREQTVEVGAKRTTVVFQ